MILNTESILGLRGRSDIVSKLRTERGLAKRLLLMTRGEGVHKKMTDGIEKMVEHDTYES